jgi:hypothetical protein
VVGGPRGAEAGREDTPFQTQTHTLGLDPEKTELYVFFLPFMQTFIKHIKVDSEKNVCFSWPQVIYKPHCHYQDFFPLANGSEGILLENTWYENT